MYPRTLIETEVKSDAEKHVFAACGTTSDDWEAYHSVGWMIRDHAEGADDGEIDFVLAIRTKAIICLEVKGGGLECRHGEWFRLIDGKQERIEDPFTQALDHRYASSASSTSSRLEAARRTSSSSRRSSFPTSRSTSSCSRPTRRPRS